MRLLIITEGYYPYNGGLEKIVTEIAEGLNQKPEYEVEVLTTTKELDGYTEVVNGITVTYVPLKVSHGKAKFVQELIKARCVMKKVLKSNYDVISIQYMGYLSAIFNSIASKTKYTVSIHGTDVTRKKGSFFRKIQKKIVENSDVVISNSNYLADELEKKLDCQLQSKLKVIWNGIHLENYSANNEVVVENTIVSVGRFVYKKGFDVLINAFEKVIKVCPNAKLVIAGDGVEKAKCEDLAKKAGIQNSVEFLGMIPNDKIADVFARGKIFVSPSRNEPFGIVVLEAMAMGVPVIVTQSGGVEEIVEDNRYGYKVPVENPEELAKKMIELLQDNSKCLELRNKGLERVKEFSIETVIQKYDFVFKKMVK